ncbi:MAG: transporter related, partial [Proteobacteria bacterium]|nr:transporter related [Pseudomonadota bacterium]
MPQLILSDASLAYGHVPLLDHADFQLDPGERVALIGRNGTGKSSMLRALAGQGALDDGSVWLQPGIRMGYVPQEPPFDPELTVFAAVVAGMGEVSALLADYHAVAHAMGEADADHEALLERMHRLQGELE